MQNGQERFWKIRVFNRSAHFELPHPNPFGYQLLGYIQKLSP